VVAVHLRTGLGSRARDTLIRAPTPWWDDATCAAFLHGVRHRVGHDDCDTAAHLVGFAARPSQGGLPPREVPVSLVSSAWTQLRVPIFRRLIKRAGSPVVAGRREDRGTSADGQEWRWRWSRSCCS
jgi:hypothetical protein